MVAQVTQLASALEGIGGTASFANASVSLGINTGATVHLDSNDVGLAIWVALGSFSMCLPEVERILYLHPGDVISFRADRVWHAMIQHPDPPHLWPEFVNCSLYVNRKQMAEFARLRDMRIAPSVGDEDPEWDSLISLEQERRYKIRRNWDMLRSLDLI